MQAPYFINEDSARGTGQIPDKEDMMYEIPRMLFMLYQLRKLTNFHQDEILLKSNFRCYVCHTPCWRRETGSYGNVRGLNRLHQFDKVELVHFVKPEESYATLVVRARNGLYI